jgi:TPP-dependent pyruvate/acetoin dehydrogenase alpha subunit
MNDLELCEPASGSKIGPAPVQLRHMHEVMVRIRRFEERAIQLFMAQEIPGFLHSCLGQEAVATGVCESLEEHDYVTITHRGHGHAIAKGLRLDRMMAEIYGKTTGYCKGKGGSMHIADFSRGVLGANGIVGGGIAIATGAALAAKVRGTGEVAVAFFGDGASSQGSFHEAANMAAVWELPVVFVCENNLYAESTPQARQTRLRDLSERAKAYGFPGMSVDGNDLVEVYKVAADAVRRARGGGGPTLLECKTYRWMGHYVGDPGAYRPAEEVELWKARDPLPRFEAYLTGHGVLTAEEIAGVHQAVERELEAAVEFARQSPLPLPEQALEDLEA